MSIAARSALICQMEPALERELKAALDHPAIQLKACSCKDPALCAIEIATTHPDVVFISSHVSLANLLQQVSRKVPVIVVSRNPETNEWLDAIEAGAADYCAPPFESAQLRWILQGAARHPDLVNANAA